MSDDEEMREASPVGEAPDDDFDVVNQEGDGDEMDDPGASEGPVESLETEDTDDLPDEVLPFFGRRKALHVLASGPKVLSWRWALSLLHWQGDQGLS